MCTDGRFVELNTAMALSSPLGRAHRSCHARLGGQTFIFLRKFAAEAHFRIHSPVVVVADGQEVPSAVPAEQTIDTNTSS